VSTLIGMPSESMFKPLRLRHGAVLLVALVAFGVLAAAAPAAFASFPTTPALDNFATDTTASPNWTTPALGEGAMQLRPLNATTNEFAGTDPGFDGALWNPIFSGPVEAWATISVAGTGDASVYADVTESGATHPTGGYFADFGGTTSGGSPNQVSIWRINGVDTVTRLTLVTAPYTNLQAGDQIGLSIHSGAIIAWFKPSGGTWSALVSTVETTYTTGRIALEDIPGTAYGFGAFGGGASSVPVSTRTTTSIDASLATANVGQQVTYTAAVASSTASVPRGTVAFVDNGAGIPGCGAQPLNASGQASCTTAYGALGTHAVSALYAGSPDGLFAGSTNGPDATVRVVAPGTNPPGTNPPGAKATTTALSLSTATPAVGAAVRYTVRVSPTPDGGTVSFTSSGTAIGPCTARPITNGIATCKVTYAAPGTHQIRAAYSGDAHFRGSATSTAKTVTVSQLLARRPDLRVGTRRLTVQVLCPATSRGCGVTSTLAIKLPGVSKAITLTKSSARFHAGKAGALVFLLNHSTQAKLRSYLRQHRHAHLGVTVRLVVRDGNRTSGTETFVYTISRALDLAHL
jgi:hypothetical protein